MSNVLLINPQDVEVYCGLSETVYSNDIDIITGEKQISFVRKVLGKALYNQLLDQVENETLSNENIALLTYIKPWLAWQVFASYINRANIHSTASGLVVNVDENYAQPDKDQLANLRSEAYNSAKTREDLTIEFLKENKSDYPLWVDNTCRKSEQPRTINISKIGGSQNRNRNIITNVNYPTRYNK